MGGDGACRCCRRLLSIDQEPLSKLAYYESRIRLIHNEEFDQDQPQTTVDEFWKEAAANWQAGSIKDLNEEEVDGTVQTTIRLLKERSCLRKRERWGNLVTPSLTDWSPRPES